VENMGIFGVFMAIRNILGPFGKCIFWPFRIFYDHMIYFTSIWYIYFPILEFWIQKNLATLLQSAKLNFEGGYYFTILRRNIKIERAALAAWSCGHRLRHRIKRSWVRISQVFRTLYIAMLFCVA
jgi:hypothetical protein